ncbi:MAG: flippase-like domain-containing protein [Myxococcales bacterium]|nr:flippase-like domain-containing protein [Myxococcales bacterium]MCB9649717.1 flippase-like domain-containing protein [Deltaproteobacteria bacterium]
MAGVDAPADVPQPKLRIGKAAVRLVGSAVLLAVVFHLVGGQAVWAAVQKTQPLTWIMGLLGFITLHTLSAAKWRFFLGLCGVNLPFKTATQCYSAGLFANLCLPSLVGGDVLRAALAVKATGRLAPVLLGSVIDRLSDVLALGLLTGIGLVIAPAAAEHVHGGTVSGPMVLIGLLGGAVLALVTLRLVLAGLPIRRLPRKLARFLVKTLRALKTLMARPTLGAMGLMFCLILQAGFVAVNVPLGEMVGLHLDLRLWYLLWPLAKIAAMVPVSLGGLGVREMAFGFLVKPFADSELAVAESLIWQSILITGGLMAGAYWLASGLRVGAKDRA